MKTNSSGWLRLGSQRDEIERLFDLYWGGKERRITRLTLRIIGVNVLALLTLVIGMAYLGQYQEKIVASKLETFQTEVYLISTTLMEGALVPSADNKGRRIRADLAENLSGSLAVTLKKRIMVFDEQGVLIADSERVSSRKDIKPIFSLEDDDRTKLQSVEILKDIGGLILSLLPKRDNLQPFHGTLSISAEDYPDVADALKNKLSMSIWKNQNDDMVLTVAMPVFDGSEIAGAALLISDDGEIRAAMGDAWFDILKIFLMTLLVTVLISIYLSGVIARPLKKLADAAENVRKGKLKYTDIPDMRDRNDEIGELSVVLRAMTQALWERMEAIESFAADVSHEIKNPLTSLRSAVETAAIVKNKEDRDRLFEVIKHDIDRLDRLITDISSASRLDAELSREMFVRFDFVVLLRSLLDLYKSPLEREKSGTAADVDFAVREGVKIEVNLGKDSVLVVGSEGRLMQVFQNIIANALSFSPMGSTILVSVVRKGARVNISIEDEGPGIPENRLENVFERFYSERPSHEEYGRHSGLGLSICRQIVVAHNGLIYAENRKTRSGKIKGAKFTVILNVVE